MDTKSINKKMPVVKDKKHDVKDKTPVVKDKTPVANENILLKKNTLCININSTIVENKRKLKEFDEDIKYLSLIRSATKVDDYKNCIKTSKKSIVLYETLCKKDIKFNGNCKYSDMINVNDSITSITAQIKKIIPDADERRKFNAGTSKMNKNDYLDAVSSRSEKIVFYRVIN